MADQPPSSSNNEPSAEPGREYPGTPRWVKVTGTILVILVLVAVIVLLFGGGPGAHTPPFQH